MPISPQPPEESLASAVTIDSRPHELTPDAPSAASSHAHPQMALVEGTAPALSGETGELLRARLRAAAILLFFGSGAFWVKHLLEADLARPSGGLLLGLHAAMVVLFGLLGGVLCRRFVIPLRFLRAAELLVFGLPILLFGAMESLDVGKCCQEGYFDFETRRWLVLMFVYAMFIPNRWPRAAVVLGAMALAPLALMGVILAINPALRGMVGVSEIAEIVLLMILAWAGSVWGVYTIGALRREVIEARQLGQYRLKQRIGAGGMGEVYLAEHQLMKRPCVIKLIRPDKAGDPRTLARFHREVRAAAKLSHWHSIDVFDYGSTAEGIFYYVMEYLPGMSLAELVERFGPMPPARVIHFLAEACEALAEAHAAGLVHRDIKPGNLFAAKRGGIYDVTKVLDFGLVKPLTDDQPLQLTAEGAITGSPLFMSPEQALGETEPDARSDIYSLGAVGYYLLVGRPPVEGDRPLKVMFAHAHEEVVPPSARGVSVPADLERVILRCLAKKPDDRYPDAPALADALAACADATGWSREDAAAWWAEKRG